MKPIGTVASSITLTLHSNQNVLFYCSYYIVEKIIFICVPYICISRSPTLVQGFKGHPLLLFPGHKQRAWWDEEQPRHAQVANGFIGFIIQFLIIILLVDAHDRIEEIIYCGFLFKIWNVIFWILSLYRKVKSFRMWIHLSWLYNIQCVCVYANIHTHICKYAYIGTHMCIHVYICLHTLHSIDR